MQERKQIGLLLIATNKYKQFVQPLIDGIEKHFLKNHNVNIFLFTDEIGNYRAERKNIIQSSIPSYKFPFASLYRYKIFDEHKELLNKMDYLFYLDVDMAIVGEVGDEIFGEGLTAVYHPGYYKSAGWGSPNVDERSQAFVPLEHRKSYFAGGFNGGRTDRYLTVCAILKARIELDEKNGVMAEWHDESHLNALLNNNNNPLFIPNQLTPSYCMVEQQSLRELWGIDHLEPKIIALNKNHKELRS